MPAHLLDTLHTVSPRYTPPPPRLTGPAIWVAALLIFVALFAQAFVRSGVGAWAVGLIYIAYDTALLVFVARRTWTIERPDCEGQEQETGNPPTLAVVIAAHNEERILKATIDALCRQSVPPDEIIVADDGSDDGTADVLEGRYGLRPSIGGAVDLRGVRIRWLPLRRGGKARALNAAVSHTTADVVVTVDADTLLDLGALEAMRSAFAADPNLAAATGVLRPVCGPGSLARLFAWFQRYEYVRNFLSRYAWMQSNSLLLVSGAFAGFRRDVLVQVGGFDPDCLVEDYEILHRIHRFSPDRNLGWTVDVIGRATATTDAPAAIMPFLRQRRRWFAGFLQTQYWNRDMIGNPRYGALGTAMLPVKALDTAQPLYGLAAAALLGVFAATGTFRIAIPILIVMAVKVAVDLTYLVWSLRIYRRWTGHRQGLSTRGAVFAALIEPLTFQLLRHAGAAWGWWVFLTGRQVWGPSVRPQIATSRVPS